MAGASSRGLANHLFRCIDAGALEFALISLRELFEQSAVAASDIQNMFSTQIAQVGGKPCPFIAANADILKGLVIKLGNGVIRAIHSLVDRRKLQHGIDPRPRGIFVNRGHDSVRLLTRTRDHIKFFMLPGRGARPLKALVRSGESGVPVVSVGLDPEGPGDERPKPAAGAAGMETKLCLRGKGNPHLLPFIRAELLRPLGGSKHDAVHSAVPNKVKLGDCAALVSHLGNLAKEFVFTLDCFANHDVTGKFSPLVLFHGDRRLLESRASRAIEGGVKNQDVLWDGHGPVEDLLIPCSLPAGYVYEELA